MHTRAQSEPLQAGTRRLSFDIETANVFDLEAGRDLDDYGPFQIAVVAAVSDRGQVFTWHAPLEAGKPGAALGNAQARAALQFLQAAQQTGVEVCAWNGLKFDLRWMAHAADDRALGRAVALELVDPLYQFFCTYGFVVSLAKVGEGLGIGLEKSMTAAEAPRAWAAGEHQRVLDYVVGDCRMTNAIVECIAERGELRWRTARGSLSNKALRPLRRVRELLDLPLPDQSWMERPLAKSSFSAWID